MAKRSQEIIEVLIFLVLYFFVFWYLLEWEKSSRAIVLGFAALALFLLASFLRHWPGAKAIGLWSVAWKGAALWVIVPCGLILLASAVVGRMASEVFVWPDANDYPAFFLWGLAQQTLLQGYFTRRFYSITGGRAWVTALLSAAMFALWHLPNERLIWVTFAGGFYMSWVYLRFPNLWAAGLVHAFISLSLVTVFKPAGFVPDYNAGPQPLSPIRRLIREYREPGTRIGEYVPSRLPSSFDREFAYDNWKMQTPVDLERFLKQKERYLFVLSEKHLETYLESHPDQQLHRLHVSYIWRRKFPRMWPEIVQSLSRGDLQRLETLFRDRMVLVSNDPKPAL